MDFNVYSSDRATLSSASADSGSIQPRTLKPLVSGSFGDTTMTSRRIFLRAAIVMGASSFDGSRVMIECGHRTRVGTAVEVDLNPPAPAKTRPWVDEVDRKSASLNSNH